MDLVALAIISVIHRSLTCGTIDIMATAPRYLMLTPELWNVSSKLSLSMGIIERLSSMETRLGRTVALRYRFASFRSTKSF